MTSSIEKLTALRGVLPTSNPFIRAADAALELGIEDHAASVLAMVRDHSPSESDGLVAAHRVLLKDASKRRPAHCAVIRVSMDPTTAAMRPVDRLILSVSDELRLVHLDDELEIIAPLPATCGSAALLGHAWEQRITPWIQSTLRGIASGDRRSALLSEMVSIDAAVKK